MLGTALVSLAALGPALAATQRDPKAVAVAEAVAEAVAPNGGWEKLAGLKFTFAVSRDGAVRAQFHHVWNIRSGDYRVEWKDQKEVDTLIVFNVRTQEGKAWQRFPRAESKTIKGSMIAVEPPGWAEVGQELGKELVKKGYGRFINDTYWLLMPLKMLDPGVNLAHEGTAAIEGTDHDVVKLTFDHVGLTPGDTYWVYVNRGSHLVDRWEYILEDQAAEAAKSGKAATRTAWDWEDWKTFGPVRLATVKSQVGGSASIIFTGVEALTTMPEDAFAPPK